MPVTRRRRVNPPDQQEANNQIVDATEQNVEATAAERPTAPAEETVSQASAPVASSPVAPVAPTQPETPPALPFRAYTSAQPPLSERPERPERPERSERPDYMPAIEPGRRTARGELFRRAPQPPIAQPPVASQPAASTQAPLQAPSHEINLPLGNLLHLAYNPGYTGSEEARSALLQKLVAESKAGGRARCWSCGSLAIAYDRWNTRSKTFGEVGVAFCEICGVWSVM
ncbi:hypothetical protein [Tengunoibacter tsumagoiensis]|uniref:Uncharacterized protein n=1 Tax=Tengunoibacter tsumagoiensis TaxID=2014871 RepID=A0A402A2J5_9CHLR|nr:hypothetical protein [Tengunoibacter tsumagoiensis]GCE13292.1 hypothetical protein KTT_31510 [Tengunoibacter tsumagoiensis]